VEARSRRPTVASNSFRRASGAGVGRGLGWPVAGTGAGAEDVWWRQHEGVGESMDAVRGGDAGYVLTAHTDWLSERERRLDLVTDCRSCGRKRSDGYGRG
jgi:hypothetical protein